MQITPGRCLFPVLRTEAASVQPAQGDGSGAAASVNTAFAREKDSWPCAAFFHGSLRTVSGSFGKLHLWKAELAGTILNAQEAGKSHWKRAQGGWEGSGRSFCQQEFQGSPSET